MDITIFNLRNKGNLISKSILNLLELVFIESDLDSKDISLKLNKDYNIEYTEEEVLGMGNLSAGTKQWGFNEGLEKGMQQGIQQGAISSYFKSVKSLINCGYSVEESIKMLSIDDDIKDIILKEFKK